MTGQAAWTMRGKPRVRAERSLAMASTGGTHNSRSKINALFADWHVETMTSERHWSGVYTHDVSDPLGPKHWAPLSHDGCCKFCACTIAYRMLIVQAIVEHVWRRCRALAFSANVRNHFRQQCRAALRRSSQEKPSVSWISPHADHDSGRREIEDT